MAAGVLNSALHDLLTHIIHTMSVNQILEKPEEWHTVNHSHGHIQANLTIKPYYVKHISTANLSSLLLHACLIYMLSLHRHDMSGSYLVYRR